MKKIQNVILQLCHESMNSSVNNNNNNNDNNLHLLHEGVHIKHI